mgnify:CR=1 FL=1
MSVSENHAPTGLSLKLLLAGTRFASLGLRRLSKKRRAQILLVLYLGEIREVVVAVRDDFNGEVA